VPPETAGGPSVASIFGEQIYFWNNRGSEQTFISDNELGLIDWMGRYGKMGKP
jgi:hypothetical protein